MRRLLLVAMMLGAATAAQAADLPDLPILRGSYTEGLSRSSTNWDGWYVGGQVGYTTANIDYTHAPASMVAFMLRESVLSAPVSNWGLLPHTHSQGSGFGGFVGRNWQSDILVVGVEANYNYFNNLGNSVSDSMSRLIANPSGENPPSGHTHIYDTTLSGGAALQIKDAVTFRGRAGWAAGGGFMPYMFGGLAVGRVGVSRYATVSYDKYDQWTETVTSGGVTSNIAHYDYLGSSTQSQSEQRVNSFVAGWTAGLGIEYSVFGGLFLRGEWEYIRFLSVKNIVFDTNNFRVGAGYKF